MSSKTITVVDNDGKNEAEVVGSQRGYEKLLDEYAVVCLRDSQQAKIRDFESLEHGGTYTLGPPIQVQQVSV